MDFNQNDLSGLSLSLAPKIFSSAPTTPSIGTLTSTKPEGSTITITSTFPSISSSTLAMTPVVARTFPSGSSSLLANTYSKTKLPIIIAVTFLASIFIMSILGFSFFWFYRRRMRATRESRKSPVPQFEKAELDAGSEVRGVVNPRNVLDGGGIEPQELPASMGRRYELAGS